MYEPIAFIIWMDYLFGILGLGDLEKIRFEQIARQRQLDRRVEKQASQCSHLINQYYLMQREVSRQQQSQFINSGLTEKIPMLRQHFKENDQYYDDLEASLQSSNFCQTLSSKYPCIHSKSLTYDEEKVIISTIEIPATQPLSNQIICTQTHKYSSIAHPH